MQKKLDGLIGKSVIVKFNTLERSGILETKIGNNIEYVIKLNRYEQVRFIWINVKNIFENLIILNDFEKGI